MKKLDHLKIVAMCLIPAAACVVGCASRTEDPDEVAERRAQVIDHDLKLLVNDLDKFFLLDRPTRLTEYPTE